MKLTTGDIMDAMGGISEQFLSEAAEGSRQIKERIWLRFSAIAASFVMICAAVSLSVFMMHKGGGITPAGSRPGITDGSAYTDAAETDDDPIEPGTEVARTYVIDGESVTLEWTYDPSLAREQNNCKLTAGDAEIGGYIYADAYYGNGEYDGRLYVLLNVRGGQYYALVDIGTGGGKLIDFLADAPEWTSVRHEGSRALLQGDYLGLVSDVPIVGVDAVKSSMQEPNLIVIYDEGAGGYVYVYDVKHGGLTELIKGRIADGESCEVMVSRYGYVHALAVVPADDGAHAGASMVKKRFLYDYVGFQQETNRGPFEEYTEYEDGTVYTAVIGILSSIDGYGSIPETRIIWEEKDGAVTELLDVYCRWGSAATWIVNADCEPDPEGTLLYLSYDFGDYILDYTYDTRTGKVTEVEPGTETDTGLTGHSTTVWIDETKVTIDWSEDTDGTVFYASVEAEGGYRVEFADTQGKYYETMLLEVSGDGMTHFYVTCNLRTGETYDFMRKMDYFNDIAADGTLLWQDFASDGAVNYWRYDNSGVYFISVGFPHDDVNETGSGEVRAIFAFDYNTAELTWVLTDPRTYLWLEPKNGAGWSSVGDGGDFFVTAIYDVGGAYLNVCGMGEWFPELRFDTYYNVGNVDEGFYYADVEIRTGDEILYHYLLDLRLGTLTDISDD